MVTAQGQWVWRAAARGMLRAQAQPGLISPRRLGFKIQTHNKSEAPLEVTGDVAKRTPGTEGPWNFY